MLRKNSKFLKNQALIKKRNREILAAQSDLRDIVRFANVFQFNDYEVAILYQFASRYHCRDRSELISELRRQKLASEKKTNKAFERLIAENILVPSAGYLTINLKYIRDDFASEISDMVFQEFE